jgi:hypothetical protein
MNVNDNNYPRCVRGRRNRDAGQRAVELGGIEGGARREAVLRRELDVAIARPVRHGDLSFVPSSAAGRLVVANAVQDHRRDSHGET